MDNEEFDELMEELGIPKDHIKSVYVCPFCYEDWPDSIVENDEGDSLIYYKDLDKNLVVDFNTLKYPDTRDLYSITAGFKINYCPMCGRKL
ncbi:hypothetical protein HWC08_gp034 [Lactobacillus phage 521B]|uniref:Uncharacterized protein n=2 Tax=Tybeckvirus TaxID=2843105 RepID=A0A4Y5FHA3_9CAUD|nr:hypothetical protein HWC08_gp034 [Lactobacillus phage 521B]YP_009844187.1 hypothetical protein HWC10_gp032 [Lactobacillus phage SAC12B]QBJ03384.1 hypothetical protein B521_0034 [Lactobacillus phage 521B]QBJ03821.1 hypothetical protein SAC12B_0032 [Lactobacillus phage SAC12B]